MKRFEQFHHIDQRTIDQMFDEYAPVFVFSTGRSGTKLLTTLFSYSEQADSHHEAFPMLQYFPNYVFHNQNEFDILKGMFMAARMELILNAYNSFRIYFESNHCLVFYAYAIADIFKNAKFIHIIRHPGTFIRSAIMKGFHLNDSIWESGRIKLKNNDEWQKYDHIEKLAWVWNETNNYINVFSRTIDKSRTMVVKLEDLSGNSILLKNIFKFSGITLSTLPDECSNSLHKKINQLVIHHNEPSNMKKVTVYPDYDKWSSADISKVHRITKDLSNFYDYEI